MAIQPARERAIQPWQVFAVVFALVALVAARSAFSLLQPRSPVRTAAPPPAPVRPVDERQARAALGRALFADASLSDPPGTSCASCHDPARAFAGDHGSPIGVPRGSRPDHLARRNTPSLLYLKFVSPFHFHWEEDVDLPDAMGGFFWDGRADSIAKLIEQPLLNPDEMNGGDRARVREQLRAGASADELRRLFGAGALDTPEAAMAALGQAIEAFLTSDEMAPFSSRYDDWLRGQGALSAEELRGLALFRDPLKGNCARCHRMNPTSKQPARSLFTDFGFESLGVPRNPALPGNRDPERFDLGLCERHEPGKHTSEDRFCGSFRTPSLRNVAVRTRYMHNGRFGRLRDVVAFYATRSIEPRRWYEGGRYDDLPARYHAYVPEELPPYDRGPGERPRLRDDEIDAIVAFLGTLTDAPFRAPTATPVAPSPVRAPVAPPPVAARAPDPEDAPAEPPVAAPPQTAPRPRHDLRSLANQPQFQPPGE
jgi:cytochrome c peroxidase